MTKTKPHSDRITLLVSLDQGYVKPLTVLLTSIALNHPEDDFELVLLHRSMPEDCLQEIERFAHRCGMDFRPIAVEDSLFVNAPVSQRYPREMYYRLLAPVLLPERIQKVLYLDPDILVINSLRPLWEMPMQGKIFAAAAHTGKTELSNNVNRLRLKTEHAYFNSGVLLIDLQQARKEISPEPIFRFVEEHPQSLVLPDQDVLNALYGERILPLDDALWNYDARNYSTYLLRSGGVQDIDWVMSHTAILHFCGKAKPWKPGYFYRFGILYKHYMQLARLKTASDRRQDR